MSVILDALKKAQNDRKDLTKSLPYDPKNRPQKSRWVVYIVASLVFCVLIVLVLIPGPRKPTTSPFIAGNTTAPPSSPPVIIEKAQSVPQSTTPVYDTHATKISPIQRVATRDRKSEKDKKKTAAPPFKYEEDKKDAATLDSSQQVLPGNELKVVISSVDHEKIAAAYNEALKETEKGNTKSAKRLYQAILAEQPSHTEALNNLGVIAMKEGNTEEALFYFNKVLQYKKDYGKAYNNIGLLMMNQGQKGLAEDYFRKSVELGKDSLEPSLNLAALLRAEKRYEEANRLLIGLLSANIKSKSLYLSYALIKDEMGQYEEAMKYYRLYLREGGSTGERNEVVERLKTLENVQSPKNR
jgi:tetratricopeptide (TPR) repeat protein